MAETLSTISVISFIAAGVLVGVAIAFWFVFKIPSVMGELSGRKARKSIELMRKNNERTGDKSFGISKTKAVKGKSTEIQNDCETGILEENKADETSMDMEATGLLDEDNETGSLEETESLDSTKRTSKVILNTLDEVILIHTKEVI